MVTINCTPFHHVIVSDDETACPQCGCISVFELKFGTVIARTINLGALPARAGGARILRGAARVLIWGALAMGVTSAVGALFGAVE